MVTESYPGYNIICRHCVFAGSSRPNRTCSQCPQAPGSLLRFEMENIEPYTFHLCGGRSINRQQLSSKNFFHTSLSSKSKPFLYPSFSWGFKKRRYGLGSILHSLWCSPASQRISFSVKLKPEESNPDVLHNVPRLWGAEASILDRGQVVNPGTVTSKEGLPSWPQKAVLSARGFLFLWGKLESLLFLIM